MQPWEIIAGEYPPSVGGVADYTQAIANGLVERGEIVRVWQRGEETEPIVSSSGVIHHRCAGNFTGSGLRRLSCDLDQLTDCKRILIQYVPHAYGCRGMNIGFAEWVRSRALVYGDDVQIMFHEVAYPWVRWPLKHNLIAAANRWMARRMIRNASTLYVSTTAWCDHLVRLGAKPEQIQLLAIPSNIPESTDHQRISQIRNELVRLGTGSIIGHFGTYGKWVSESLRPILENLLQQRTDVHIMLLGGGSVEFRDGLVVEHPHFASRLSATGRIETMGVANHLSACDLMLQPFPDGANTRRTSLMACLINGVATVSNVGHNTESIWRETQAVALAPNIDPITFVNKINSLLSNSDARLSQALRGKRVYDQYFDISRTIDTLIS